MREKIASFRMSILPFLAVVTAWGIGIGSALGLVIIWFLWPGPFVAMFALVCGIGGAEAASLAGVLILVACYPVHVGAWGVRGFDFWGIYHETTWEEIAAVRPINFLGLRFLRAFRAGKRRPLWLPLFLADMRGFTELVRRHAGPAHPLARGLFDGN